jgi:hypothetical protein
MPNWAFKFGKLHQLIMTGEMVFGFKLHSSNPERRMTGVGLGCVKTVCPV